MRKSIAASVGMLLFFGAVYANNPDHSQAWSEGEVVLMSGEKIEGLINIDYKLDIVQCKRQNGSIMAFSPVKVSHFSFFDQEIKNRRFFAAINFENRYDYEHKSFFEVIINGELSVLRKGKYVKRVPVRDGTSNHYNVKTIVHHNYYVFTNDEQKRIRNFRKDVLPMMEEHEEKLARYIKKHKLNVNELVDQLMVVNYYNYLGNPNYSTSSQQSVSRSVN